MYLELNAVMPFSINQIRADPETTSDVLLCRWHRHSEGTTVIDADPERILSVCKAFKRAS